MLQSSYEGVARLNSNQSIEVSQELTWELYTTCSETDLLHCFQGTVVND